MNSHPELLSATPPLTDPASPPKPHPVDVALAALSEMSVELLASGKLSRFAELQSVTQIAMQIQRLRPMAGVEDAMGVDDENGVVYGGGIIGRIQHPIAAIRGHNVPRFNDGADLNREIIMLAQSFLTTAQSFLTTYAEA